VARLVSYWAEKLNRQSAARTPRAFPSGYNQPAPAKNGEQYAHFALRWVGVDMKVLTSHELQASGVRTLGLDPQACAVLPLEPTGAALRRAVGFLWPCPQRSLVQGVVEPLERVASDREQFYESVENTVEAMITYGDLLEEYEVAAIERPCRSPLLY